jgi:hypothetical protein
MVYFSGQSSRWERHPHAAPLPRRVRYNAATHFYETIGDGTPPLAYRTVEEASAAGDPTRP